MNTFHNKYGRDTTLCEQFMILLTLLTFHSEYRQITKKIDTGSLKKLYQQFAFITRHVWTPLCPNLSCAFSIVHMLVVVPVTLVFKVVADSVRVVLVCVYASGTLVVVHVVIIKSVFFDDTMANIEYGAQHDAQLSVFLTLL